DEPVAEPEPIQAAAVTHGSRDTLDARQLDAHLLPSLAGRPSWSTRQVKVDLDKPDLRIELANPNGQRAIVDAWASSQNDQHGPLVRVDWSDRLIEITPDEFALLKRRSTQ